MVLLMLVSGSAEPVVAADALTLYAGQGVDADLLEVPGRLLQGDLDYEGSYFSAVGYGMPLPPPRVLKSLLGWLVDEPYTGMEFISVKHWGLQNNWEADLAYVIGTPAAEIGPLRVRFNFALGLSYAFGTPSYEDGPIDDPDRRYRFQNYNAYELVWGLVDLPRVHLVTRIHHRSGIYGLIAPRHVGSNFVTLGLRFDLPD